MKRLAVPAVAGCVILATVFGSAVVAAPPKAATLTIHADKAGAAISPLLFGLMFEDINHSGDGGIYGELLTNRVFQDNPASPDPWAAETGGKADGTIDIDKSRPVNSGALNTSLLLNITHSAPGGYAGAANFGYFGLAIRPSTTYHASFYARVSTGMAGPLSVRIENVQDRIIAAASVANMTIGWHHFTVNLTTPAGIKPSDNNHFVIAANHTGKVWLSLVSLFGPTWNNRPNGMRTDLMKVVQALHPAFLRFPGGNFLEGQTIDTRFEWKNTIGELSQRPGHQNDAWGYRSSDGLGLLEYLEWAEDLNMAPVLAVYAGYSLDGNHVDAGTALKPYVQDALDEIQYATGATSTRWGAKRAADGHPAPFKVQYVEIGNEDFFDHSGSYNGRFAQFYDAIRKAYPAIKLMATTDVSSRKPDILDQHFYETPTWFTSHTDYYDTYSRSGAKIFVGEYAARTPENQIGQGPATLGTAIGEAAWMTGLERNSDVVIMASYAPLLQNVNGSQWSPDLISFDNLNSYGSPSYYVQQLFSLNHGNSVVPMTASGAGTLSYVASTTEAKNTLYVSVVNSTGSMQPATIAITGVAAVAPAGTVTVLTSGSPDDENSLTTPRKVYPTTKQLRGLNTSFHYTLAPNSVSVFRLTIRP